MDKPWNYHSHVKACEVCNGAGWVPAHRRPTIDDPYPENRCNNCDGEHEPECEVCGYNLQVRGVDCLICDTIAIMTKDELRLFDIDDFARAAKRAVKEASNG